MRNRLVSDTSCSSRAAVGQPGHDQEARRGGRYGTPHRVVPATRDRCRHGNRDRTLRRYDMTPKVLIDLITEKVANHRDDTLYVERERQLERDVMKLDSIIYGLSK